MNESGKWTEVDYSDINGLKIEKNYSNDNVKLSLMLSPMDVPIAWRHLEEDGKVILEFKYVSNGESVLSKDVGNISFELGKNSRRIYRIIVDLAGFMASGVQKGRIEFELKLAEATTELKEAGVVKKPNAKAIMNMIEHEHALAGATAAG